MSGQPPVELIDCGRASARTCGLPFLIADEAVVPPFNKIFLIEPR
jgi:hypothetical protein